MPRLARAVGQLAAGGHARPRGGGHGNGGRAVVRSVSLSRPLLIRRATLNDVRSRARRWDRPGWRTRARPVGRVPRQRV